jgi:hypothetical protein
MNFLDLFTNVEKPKLGTITRSDGEVVTCLIVEHEGKELSIPFYKHDDLEQVAMQLVLAAATDRNLLVYDSSALPGSLTPTLFAFMGAAGAANSRPIDGYLTRATIHEFWTSHVDDPLEVCKIKDYYINYLRGSFAKDDKELILGVDPSYCRRVFVKYDHYWDGTALGILNADGVLLGSY